MADNRLFYPAVLSQNSGEEIAVVFPDFDAATSGADEQDALLSAQELLCCLLAGLAEDELPVPPPSPTEAIPVKPGEWVVLVPVLADLC